MLERIARSIQQFIEGLNILNVYDKIKKFPEYFIELFCYTNEGLLTLTKMNEMFIVDYSEGSNRRQVERRVAAFWKDFLLDCNGMYQSFGLYQKNVEKCSFKAIE